MLCVKTIIQTILDAIFPEKCLVCEKLGKGLLCATCFKSTFVPVKNNIKDNYQILFEYNDHLKRTIKELKYNKNLKILPSIEQAIFKHVKNIYQDIDFIVPIPLNPLREKERGFNQTELMIKKYALFHKIPLRKDIINRKYNTEKSHKLNKEERFLQSEKAFSLWDQAAAKVKNKKILVFDDIITTRTTVKHVTELLLASGAAKVMILAFCTPEHKKQFNSQK